MAGWTPLEFLLRFEIIQRTQEGCKTDGYKELLDASPKDEASLNHLYDSLMALPIDESFPYQEPSDLDGIRRERPEQQPTLASAPPSYDSFLGAWLGRSAGCALGKPVEAGPFMGGRNGIPGWKLVYEWFAGAGAYPIHTYTPGSSSAEQVYGIRANQIHSLRETIQYMETDDDIRYTVLGLILMEEKGLQWDTWDVGNLWLSHLPYYMVCTAERQAYLNLPFAHDQLATSTTEQERQAVLDWVRTYRNPYREWIGAQIRVDGYAYAAAGNPELAAELAWRDASLSHAKNGIYGAMYCSAMIADAFVEKDTESIIQAGLRQIPRNCRLAHDIRKAMEITATAKDELDLVSKIWDAFCHYDPVHTNNNAALCTAALLYAGDDFEKAITTAVLGGWDTDCNGATVGSIMGAKLGASNLPKSWTEPLHDTLYSAIPGFHPIAISECAKRSYGTYQKIKG